VIGQEILKKSLNISMWNGILNIKNHENHDELNFSIWNIYILEKNSMHLTIKLFILWWPIFYVLFWYY
jgi:hypothetical protein